MIDYNPIVGACRARRPNVGDRKVRARKPGRRCRAAFATAGFSTSTTTRGLRGCTFEVDYRLAVEPVFARGLQPTLCTIYNGAFEDPRLARRARVALMMFNDVIVRMAFEHQVSMIDLRLVCSEAADYANPIEPSGPGGLKIAKAILRATALTQT